MSDLADLRTRIETQYMDTNNLVLDDATLDEGIRSALGEISRVYGSALTIEGLDAALETTLAALDIPCLLTGATAYGLNFLLQNHFNNFSSSLGANSALVTAAQKMRVRFRTMLEELRLDDLQRSQTYPHSDWIWQELAPWRTAD